MCLAAAYWAHVRAIYYGANAADAARAGFDDAFLYDEMRKDHAARAVPSMPDAQRRSLGKLQSLDRISKQSSVLAILNFLAIRAVISKLIPRPAEFIRPN